jgi:hypothetical protein
MRMHTSLVVTVALCLTAVLAGCAAPTGTSTREVREPAETVTGSNLPRRDRRDSGVREADKDAIQSELRGQTRNTGN